MSRDNEFLRGKPGHKNRNLLYDMTNLIIPILFVVAGVFVSSQHFAKLVKYNPQYVGQPVYITPKSILGLPAGYPVFNPGETWLSMASGLLDDTVQNAILPTLFYLLFFVGLAVVVFFTMSIIRGRGFNKNENLYGTSRWADEHDLKKFYLDSQTGVILAQQYSAHVTWKYNPIKASFSLHLKHSAPLVGHAGGSNTLVLAPTGSGKGVSTVIPTALSYPGHMVILDPKAEIYNITAGYRKKFSHVLKFSPVSDETVHFNPYAECRLTKSLGSNIDLISSIIFERGVSTDTKNDFWDNCAAAFYNSAVCHVLTSGLYEDNVKNISSIIHIIKKSSAEKTRDAQGNETESGGETFLHEMNDNPHYDGNGEHQKYLDDYVQGGANQMLAMNPKVRSDVFTTLFSKLELFEDAYIAEVTSHSDFSLEDFYESKSPITLYLTVPYGEMKRIMPVFKLIINFILNRFSSYEIRLGKNERKLSHEMLFLLDEFPALGKQQQIMENLGVLRGFGIHFFIICQSLVQLQNIYGEKNTFFANSKTVMVFAPGELSEAKAISEIIGKQSVSKDSLSTSGNRYAASLNNLNLSSQEIARDLINPDELMKLPPDQAVILNQGMPPYVAKKNVYYDDDRYRYIAYSDYRMRRQKVFSVHAPISFDLFGIKQGDVLFTFTLPFVTERFTPGFPAPYSEDEILAECRGLPSHMKKKKAVQRKAVPAAAAAPQNTIKICRQEAAFSPADFLASCAENSDSYGTPDDNVSSDSEPPPTCCDFDNDYYVQNIHTA